MQPPDPHNTLILFAMRAEAGRCFDGVASEMLVCGLGKINATYALTRRLADRRPGLVLSFGTAGSLHLPAGTLVECTRFVQRDMDVQPLSVPLGTTPLDPTPPVIEVPRRFDRMVEGICGTGDNFVASQPTMACDVVDMEAYALAKVCHLERIPFVAIKYVTDNGNSTAQHDWRANLPAAASTFRRIYDEFPWTAFE
jgi:adenosylhomocysteine nucleosidase